MASWLFRQDAAETNLGPMPPDETLTVVYTDGACSGNPGRGGWAWVEPDGAFAAGPVRHTTNQRMEITAAAQAVYAHGGPLEVRSDSTYVVNCFRDRWWEGWERRGWLNSQRKPVANRDLWEPFVEAVRRRGDVRFTWVKGHSGDRWNDIADRLAVQAMTDERELSGDRRPGQLGPPDARPAAERSDARRRRRCPTGRPRGVARPQRGRRRPRRGARPGGVRRPGAARRVLRGPGR